MFCVTNSSELAGQRGMVTSMSGILVAGLHESDTHTYLAQASRLSAGDDHQDESSAIRMLLNADLYQPA